MKSLATKKWVGVDVGGTKVAMAFVDGQGNVIDESTIPTEVEKGPDYTVGRIIETLEELSKKNGIIPEGIGICTPGPLNVEKGLILTPSNLPTWYHYPIVQKIGDYFQGPVILGNDADMAGYGEYRFGLLDPPLNAVYVTVSTGIGGGIISNGRLHVGASSSAAEFGHAIAQKDGPLCGCGKHGCVEAFSSGMGIANRMEEEMQKKDLQTNTNTVKRWTTKEVFDAYDEGNLAARLVIEKAEDYLSIALANIITIFNPSVLIMGGGVTFKQPDYIERALKKIPKFALSENAEKVKIVKASLGSRAGVIGAAALCMEDIF